MKRKRIRERKFLTQWQMAEAKRVEAVRNSKQKREGTNFPLSSIFVGGCGCCIGPVIQHWNLPVLSADEADEILKLRKYEDNQTKHENN